MHNETHTCCTFNYILNLKQDCFTHTILCHFTVAQWRNMVLYGTRPSSVQVMACCLFGTKPVPEPLPITSSTQGNTLQWNLKQNTNISIWPVSCAAPSHFPNHCRSSIGAVKTNFNGIWIKTQAFLFKKCIWKCCVQKNHNVWALKVERWKRTCLINSLKFSDNII